MKLDRVIAVRGDRTVYQNGGVCVKRFARADAKAAALREALNLTLAEAAGVRAPGLIEVKAIDGKWALITEYVRGDVLSRRIEAGECAVDDGMRLLLAAQLNVQARPAEGFASLRDQAANEIRAAALNAPVKDALLRRLDSLEDGESLCHGDFTPENLILAPDGAPVLLDWARAARGSACGDAAHTWLRLTLDGRADWAEAYMRALNGADALDADCVRQWLPVAAAARLHRSNRRERELLLRLLGEWMGSEDIR